MVSGRVVRQCLSFPVHSREHHFCMLNVTQAPLSLPLKEGVLPVLTIEYKEIQFKVQ